MTWMTAIANERVEDTRRMELIAELKQWVKKIIRLNKGHGIDVIVCSDFVLLQFLKCRKSVIPSVSDLILRLKAVRV